MSDSTKSILTTVKRVLGLAEDYTAFDPDIIMHINATFATLNQLGLGPATGFEIVDDTAVWADFTGDDPRYNGVQSYVYLRVRMLFDPPDTGQAIIAYEKQIEQAEWRLNMAREEIDYPEIVVDPGDNDYYGYY